MKKVLILFLCTVIFISIFPIFHLFLTDSKEDRKGNKGDGQKISVYNIKTDKVTEEDMEEYLIGVVTAEMPALYEVEALKAQAVAARSYILTKIGKENPDHNGADVCTNPAHCKAYTSSKEAKEKWGDDYDKFYKKIKSAVDETKGEFISYQGETAVACFYAVSGGRTENASDVWGGDTPYLRSVESLEDLSYENLKETVSFSREEALSRLGINDLKIGDLKRTEGGSVKNISIGGNEFSGTEIRSIFGLSSANFEAEATENGLTFITTGKGHGVGMSQYGANQMAKSGKTYQEILLHYYQGVTIEKI